MRQEYKDSLIHIKKSHDSIWSGKKNEMSTLRDIYMARYWSSHDKPASSLYFESDAGNTFVEMYVNGLLTNQPSVTVLADPTSTNDPNPVEAISNRWLISKRDAFENATRHALIYPSAFIKICAGPYNKDNTITKLDAPFIEAIFPWDIIVDRDASCWDRQRYVGHKYYVPISEAKRRYPSRKYKARAMDYYFDESCEGPSDDHYKYIQVIEHYDLLEDKFVIWTEDTDAGFSVLKEGEIPIRTPNDEPLVGIVPLYFGWNPSIPLDGMSTLSKIAPKVIASNRAHTWFNKDMEKTSRKTIVDQRLGEEVINGLLSSDSSQYLLSDVALEPGMIMPAPQPDIPIDFYKYLQDIDKSINEASILAPINKGQPIDPTKTATEINFMMSASGTELAKFSRQKDDAIARMAEIYIRMLHTLLKDKDTMTIEVDGKAFNLTRDDISSDFTYTSIDQGASPIATQQRVRDLVSVAPLLMQLGTPQEEIAKQIITGLKLSDSLIPKPKPIPEAPTQSVDTNIQLQQIPGV